MAKGIIVVNATERCNQCKFWFAKSTMPIKYMCMARQKEITEKNLNENKPDWCPIKPLPEKLPEHEPVAYKDSDDNWVNRMKRLPEHCGWNACLDVLLED